MDVPQPGDRPFDRAWILLALVQSTFELAHWHEVYRRAHKIDDRLHSAAVRRLREAISGHRQSRALHALSTAAREAAEEMDAPPSGGGDDGNASGASELPRRGGQRRPRMTREACDIAAHALGNAVLSLALTPELEPVDVALLTSPVLTTLRTLDEAPPHAPGPRSRYVSRR